MALGSPDHKEWWNRAQKWSRGCTAFVWHVHWGVTLPATNIEPENGWLEYERFLLGCPIFRCYASFRECKSLFRNQFWSKKTSPAVNHSEAWWWPHTACKFGTVMIMTHWGHFSQDGVNAYPVSPSCRDSMWPPHRTQSTCGFPRQWEMSFTGKHLGWGRYN